MLPVLAFGCAAPGGGSAVPVPNPSPARIVAIGDIHGDPEAALDVLRIAGLADASGAWSGGEAWLVQTGDVTDRGPDSHGVIVLLRRLQREAAAAGGKVIPLLGNHEVMNMQGDLRYVSEGDYAGYGGPEKRALAFSASGEDGAWLRGLDAIAQVGDTLFMHGGLDANWAAQGVPALNALVRAAIPTPKHPVLGPDGPLWNRSYLLGDEATICPELTRALALTGATRMVLGHTTQDSGKVASRCEGRLYGIDTGISAYYGGHRAALELRGDIVTPLYPTAAVTSEAAAR